MYTCICSLLIAAIALTASAENIVADGATLETLATEFAFTEGPAADAQGNVYFTDQPNDRIVVWSTDEKLSTYMQPSGRSNGLCFDAKGALWACADEKNELWRIAKDKTYETMLDRFDGKLLNAPNDLWITPGGAIYFSDPYYKRDYWTRGPAEQDVEAVYYIPAPGKPAIRVITDLKQPNGLIGTPDGKTLYVADIGGNKTWKYSIGSDGALSGKALFCELGSDGMTIDSEGNVYLTGKGVIVFNPAGEQIAHIEVPMPWTANVCFGGADKKSLFITASTGLYRMRMRVSGVDSQ
ncbi:MAG: SMP-30/gluconolactonase/LRE family protein [Candidatus Hydrogenedentes bacterium]|nr:SMP-30/gluconolactonase/LRE family protein [Candidatus Hydrogenedentota bacterium]